MMTFCLNGLCFEVVKLLNNNKNIDFIYSDEDKIDRHGNRDYLFFKPDFSPNSLICNNYICHLSVYRTSLLKELGGLRKGFEGAQDFDLVLRFTENTNRIAHIPKILYHWRMHSSSTAINTSSKNYAFENGKKAIESAMERRNILAEIEMSHVPGIYHLKYDLLTDEEVSIIIRTNRNHNYLNTCLASIQEKTKYRNISIILINSHSENKAAIKQSIKLIPSLHGRIKIVDSPHPNNFSLINNFSVLKTDSKYLVFLDGRTNLLANNWITNMLRYEQQQEIGVIGTKLYFPNHSLQHAGLILGLGGVAGYGHQNFYKNDPGYFGRLVYDSNYAALKALCFMVKREDFDTVNGFDEKLGMMYYDIDFCLKYCLWENRIFVFTTLN